MSGNIDEIKFDEYKFFIDDTARFTDRRQSASNFYISVNSLLLTAMVFIVADADFAETWTSALSIAIAVVGIFISLWWKQVLKKYKLLVGLRFDVLRKMENSEALDGLEKMYHQEDALYPRWPDGKIKQGVGLNFSDLEAKLPILFVVLYVLTAVGVLINLFWI